MAAIRRLHSGISGNGFFPGHTAGMRARAARRSQRCAAGLTQGSPRMADAVGHGSYPSGSQPPPRARARIRLPESTRRTTLIVRSLPLAWLPARAPRCRRPSPSNAWPVGRRSVRGSAAPLGERAEPSVPRGAGRPRPGPDARADVEAGLGSGGIVDALAWPSRLFPQSDCLDRPGAQRPSRRQRQCQ